MIEQSRDRQVCVSLQFFFILQLFSLCQGAEFKIVADFQNRFPDRDISEALIQASGKLVLVDKLLPKLKENGHKVTNGRGQRYPKGGEGLSNGRSQ